MGACFHIAGVFCDNCRTGMSEERPRSLIFPMAPMSDECDITGPYPQLLATAAEVASLRAEVERLREVARKVHALTTEEAAWETFPGMTAKYMREIHKITKEGE